MNTSKEDFTMLDLGNNKSVSAPIFMLDEMNGKPAPTWPTKAKQMEFMNKFAGVTNDLHMRLVSDYKGISENVKLFCRVGDHFITTTPSDIVNLKKCLKCEKAGK
jgi:hypothetical protein